MNKNALRCISTRLIPTLAYVVLINQVSFAAPLTPLPVEELPSMDELSKATITQTTDTTYITIDETQDSNTATTTDNISIDNTSADKNDATPLDEIEELLNNNEDLGQGQDSQNTTEATLTDDAINEDNNLAEQPDTEQPKVNTKYQLPTYEYSLDNLSEFAQEVNAATWDKSIKVNPATTVKIQALLDWNHASPGPIDGGWGMNSKKALRAFETMHGLPVDGRMDDALWQLLSQNNLLDRPALVNYTLTQTDVNTRFGITPRGSEAKSKVRGLYYQNITEMLAERFHMDIRFLRKLNRGIDFKAGDTITVFNIGSPLDQPINKLIANKKDETLYAYNGEKMVAAYPTTVGSSSTPSPHGGYKIVNKVLMPWYKATKELDDGKKQIFMLPPGPNNPVGVVWMGLSKPTYGIHGSPMPERISRQASHGCVRLTNWDVLEVYANVEKGSPVYLK